MKLLRIGVRCILMFFIVLTASILSGQTQPSALSVLDYIYLKNNSRLIGYAVYSEDNSMLVLQMLNGNLMTIPMSSIKKIKQRIVTNPRDASVYKIRTPSRYSHNLSLSVVAPAFEEAGNSPGSWLYGNPYSNGGIQIDYKAAYQIGKVLHVGVTGIVQKGYLQDHSLPNTGIGLGGAWTPLEGNWSPFLSLYSGYLKVWNFGRESFFFRPQGGFFASPVMGMKFERRNGRSWHFGSGMVWQQMSSKYQSNDFSVNTTFSLKRWVFQVGMEL